MNFIPLLWQPIQISADKTQFISKSFMHYFGNVRTLLPGGPGTPASPDGPGGP